MDSEAQLAAARVCRPGRIPALVALGFLDPDTPLTAYLTEANGVDMLHVADWCARTFGSGPVRVEKTTAGAIAATTESGCDNCPAFMPVRHTAPAAEEVAVNHLTVWATERWRTGLIGPDPTWKGTPEKATDLVIEAGFLLSESSDVTAPTAQLVRRLVAGELRTLTRLPQVQVARARNALNTWSQGLDERERGGGSTAFDAFPDPVVESRDLMVKLTRSGSRDADVLAWYNHVTAPTVWVSMLDLSADQLLHVRSPAPEDTDTGLARMPIATAWGPSTAPRIRLACAAENDADVHAAARLLEEGELDRLPQMVNALTAART